MIRLGRFSSQSQKNSNGFYPIVRNKIHSSKIKKNLFQWPICSSSCGFNNMDNLVASTRSIKTQKKMDDNPKEKTNNAFESDSMRLKQFCDDGKPKEAEELLREMKDNYGKTKEKEELLNELSHQVLSSIGTSGNINQMYHFISKNIDKPDIDTYDRLVEAMAMYGSTFDIINVIKTTQRMKIETSEKMKSYLIISSAEMGRIDLMKQFYDQFVKEPVPTQNILNAMIGAYLVIDMLDEALLLKEEFKKYQIPLDSDSHHLLAEVYRKKEQTEDYWIHMEKADPSFSHLNENKGT